MTDGNPVILSIDRGKLIRRLVASWIAIEIGLWVFDYFINWKGVHIIASMRNLADLAQEDSLPTLMAVVQVGLLSLTLWFVFLTARACGASRWELRGWIVVAAFFTYMTIDDGSRLHERVGTSVGVVLDSIEIGRFAAAFPSYAWQLVYLPLFGFFGLFMVYFFWNTLQPKYSRLLVLGGVACMVVAVGMDFVEGLDPDHRFNLYTIATERFALEGWSRANFHTGAYRSLIHFSRSTEEVIEMFGNTLIWVAVVRHWTAHFKDVTIRFRGN